MKILIVEDDKDILELLVKGFTENNYIIDTATNGLDAQYLATTSSYDIIILDWMLPQKSGIEVLQYLRKQNIITPILMLTAKDDTKDKILGLKTGADDYLAKPFSFDELIARVEALYRRVSFSNSNKIIFKDITIDIDKKIVLKSNNLIELSAKEYELLLLLIKNKNSYISKQYMQENLWNNEEFIQSNVIEATIYKLRKKLGKEYIKNFRGLGYKIEI
jgi:DNA-binding response OmpR family regulator